MELSFFERRERYIPVGVDPDLMVQLVQTCKRLGLTVKEWRIAPQEVWPLREMLEARPFISAFSPLGEPPLWQIAGAPVAVDHGGRYETRLVAVIDDVTYAVTPETGLTWG